MAMFPYDVNELADGPVRCMFAPITEPLPDRAGGRRRRPTRTTPNGDWVDFGATAGPWSVNRNIATASYNIQQTTTAVLERVTEVIRAVAVNVAEIRPDIMTDDRGGHRPTTVATVGGVGAHQGPVRQHRRPHPVPHGVRRPPLEGPGRRHRAGAIERGRLWGYVAYRVQLQADNFQLGFAEGDLATANVTFRLNPEPGQPEGEEHGYWVFEDAGHDRLVRGTAKRR